MPGTRISLREAADISGYSADYVGQLIRSGKIPGKQVYSNVQWMTTAEAVFEYKNKGKSSQKTGFKDKVIKRKRRIAMEFSILKLFFQNFRSAWALFLLVIVSFFILSFYIIYFSLEPIRENASSSPKSTSEDVLSF